MNKIATSIGRYLAAAIVAAAILATGSMQTTSGRPTNLVATQPVVRVVSSATLTSATHVHPSFCVLGKAHKKGKGCRGGSVAKKVKPELEECVKNGSLGYEIGSAFGTPGKVAGAAVGCAYKSNKKEDSSVLQSPGWEEEPAVTSVAENPHPGSSVQSWQ